MTDNTTNGNVKFAQTQEFLDEIDEALATAFHRISDQVYVNCYAMVYPEMYETCLEDGLEQDVARSTAKSEARKEAQSRARALAADQISSEGFEFVQDICDRHGVWAGS